MFVEGSQRSHVVTRGQLSYDNSHRNKLVVGNIFNS